MSIISTAFIDGLFRYSLGRSWDSGLEVAWIMLNPSTADAEFNDATIRRCIGFSKSWGYKGLKVANLFAFRATDPRELSKAIDPIGPMNDEHILEVAASCEKVICAWGSNGTFMDRESQVLKLLSDFPIFHLGLTRGGQPKHPLYLSAETKPVPFLIPQPESEVK